jgi:hypothetical protein
MKASVLFFMVLFCYSCSKKGNDLVFNPTQNHLEFGNGGGFTGAVSSIYVLENGDVFRKATSDTTYVKVGRIDAKKAKQLFINYKSLGLGQMQLNEPGNRYYFISSVDKGEKHKLQWGKTELKNNSPELLYKIMNDMVKKLDENKQTQH